MREGDTPLIDAARHGRTADVASLLADGADVNEPKTDGSGGTALYLACQEGHTEIVTILIAAATAYRSSGSRGGRSSTARTARSASSTAQRGGSR